METCPECGKDLLQTVKKDGVGASAGDLPEGKIIRECAGCGYRSDYDYTIVFDERTGKAEFNVGGARFSFHVGLKTFAEHFDGDIFAAKKTLAREARRIVEEHLDNNPIETYTEYRFEFHNGHFYDPLQTKFGDSE